jgi:hypothetical protein
MHHGLCLFVMGDGFWIYFKKDRVESFNIKKLKFEFRRGKESQKMENKLTPSKDTYCYPCY